MYTRRAVKQWICCCVSYLHEVTQHALHAAPALYIIETLTYFIQILPFTHPQIHYQGTTQTCNMNIVRKAINLALNGKKNLAFQNLETLANKTYKFTFS